MNVDDLQRKLISAAKAASPSSDVPYGFERRVMTRIKGLATPDYWAIWARALWRAAGPCVVVALLLAVLSFFIGPGSSAGPDLSQEFENTVLAAANLEPAPSDAQQ